MAKFCKHCGHPLVDGQKCSCQPASEVSEFIVKGKALLFKALERIGIEAPSSQSANFFENNQKIVPDIIKETPGEIPVKQYEVATMRSRIRGQYAKGRLQITNKRVLFRAAGLSLKGPIAQQYEFALGDIGGIEIKKSSRVSGLNILCELILNSLLVGIFTEIFSGFAKSVEFLAFLLAISFAAAAIVLFFAIPKKFWLKFAAISAGAGAMTGVMTVIDAIGASSPFLTALATGITSILALVMLPMVWISFIVLAMVSDLILTIKTKGAGEAFTIRRKQRSTLFNKQEIEYSSFSEVVPGRDVDMVISELGTLIDDIQTYGDGAIEKWKENA